MKDDSYSKEIGFNHKKFAIASEEVAIISK